MKIWIHTLGCRVNHVESQALLSELLQMGFEHSFSWDNADLIIIHSCTVTAQSDKKSLQYLRRAQRQAKKVVLLGCYASVHEEQSNEEILYLPNEQKHEAAQKIRAFAKVRTKSVVQEDVALSTRTFLKIQDGCDAFCSYCIIPHARGRSRSIGFEEIVQEARTALAKNHKELVFTGIHLCDYEHKGRDLIDILKAVDAISGDFRIRLGSLDPDYLMLTRLEELMRIEHLGNHLHLSVQSASNAVLKKMNRHYTREHLFCLLRWMRQEHPEVSIGADFIAGFPGETKEDHQQTLNFIETFGIEYSHVFVYSQRQFTPAASWIQLSKEVRKKRAKELRVISEGVRDAYLKSFVGRFERVLSEGEGGYTSSYSYVRFVKSREAGVFLTVEIGSHSAGELIEKE